MKITLTDNTEIKCKSLYTQRRYFSGADRECITITIDPTDVSDYSVDSLCKLFSDDTVLTELLVSDETDSSTTETRYYDYSMLAEISIDRKKSKDSDDVTYVLTVVLAQKTYAEKTIDSRNEQVDMLCEVVADILGGAE